MAKYVFEILDEVTKAKSKADKVAILKKNESWPLKDVLRGTYDSTVKWGLPGGEPPYTPSEAHNHPATLFREFKKFGYFIENSGKARGVPKFKIEQLFIGLIEGSHPEDAKVVIDMINKSTRKGLTRPVIQEAFPGLLRD